MLFLPIRPLLLGGDDITFVCDGRIALELATEALTLFEQMDALAALKGKIRACAGVALVKTHAPFSRAYDLAESLCISAKKLLRKNEKEDWSALDWHIGLNSPTETLSALRQRQYRVPLEGQEIQNYILTCRPYLLRQYEGLRTDPSWEWLIEDVLSPDGKGFRTSNPRNTPNWQAHRSKLKTLREIVREGSSEVAEAFQTWKVAHPLLALPDKMKNGFIGQETPLLDAVELLDIHFPLYSPRGRTNE